MKPIEAFLAELGSREIKLWFEDDKLRLNAPAGAITDSLKREIAERKQDIKTYLEKLVVQAEKAEVSGNSAKTGLPQQWLDRLSKSGLSVESYELFDTTLKKVKAWNDHRVTEHSLILNYNGDSDNLPLFLCIDYASITRLSSFLGSDQPVYAMRVGYGLIENSPEQREALARYYLSEILEIQPQGPYMLGGFCQGAKIAYFIARQLQNLGHEVALLCLIDNILLQPYHGNMVLFVARKSMHNPRRFFGKPDRWLKTFYNRQLPCIEKLPGDHRSWWRMESSIKLLAELFRKHIIRTGRQKESSEDHNKVNYPSLPDEYYRAEIIAPATQVFVRSLFTRHVDIQVKVINRSDREWRVEEIGPIHVGCCWFQEIRYSVLNFEVGARMPDLVKAGESIEIPIRLAAPWRLGLFQLISPRSVGRYRLEIDLLDQYNNWFKDHGAKPSITFIHMPGNRKP